jgi:DNA-binding NarL/FixJ family response regulator
MNVLLCETAHSQLQNVAGLLNDAPGVNVVAIARTGREALRVLNSEPVDLSIHSEDTVDLSRLIRHELRDEVAESVSRVVAAEAPTTPLIVKAHQLGFDGILTVPQTAAELAAALKAVLTRRNPLSEHPIIKTLDLSPGALDRRLRYANQTEIGIADLMGIGLADQDIATAMQLSLQSVRNHIESLLHANSLSNRTQLAVLRAIDWSIPDFA